MIEQGEVRPIAGRRACSWSPGSSLASRPARSPPRRRCSTCRSTAWSTPSSPTTSQDGIERARRTRGGRADRDRHAGRPGFVDATDHRRRSSPRRPGDLLRVARRARGPPPRARSSCSRAPWRRWRPARTSAPSTPVGLDGGDCRTRSGTTPPRTIRGLAEQRTDANAEIAETLRDRVASITAEEALDGDMIDLIADSERELLDELDGTDGRARRRRGPSTLTRAGAASRTSRMTAGSSGFLHDLFDPNLAFIFFWLGLALIVLELIVPGHVFSRHGRHHPAADPRSRRSGCSRCGSSGSRCSSPPSCSS